MSSSNFRKAYPKRVQYKQTEIITKGFHFTVVGKVKNRDHFVELYLEKRAKMTEHIGCFINGVYDKSKDHGYLNLLKVLESGKYEIKEFDYDYTYRVPATLKCCDTWMELDNFTNTCSKCGTDYNSSGQQLAARHFWGEETGENWYECY